MHIGQQLLFSFMVCYFPKYFAIKYQLLYSIFPHEKIITSLYRFGLVANLSLYDIDT